MQLLSRSLVQALLALLVLSCFWLVPYSQAEVLINEVLGDPAQDWNGDGEIHFKSDEWIEVRNDGSVVEDLTEYWLRDATGEELHFHLIGNLEPGETAVFYGSDAMAWQQENGQSTVGFSINNSGDTLELLRLVPGVTGSSLIVVSQVTLLSHEVEDDRSSGWDIDTEQWTLFDALNPYGGALEPQGSECLPTPGELNICATLVQESGVSWDKVKSQYR